MITAEIDMGKLRRSLTKAAKNFGESNRQAVARWGVQTCRELAVSTQVFGKAGAKKKQIAAIEAGIHGAIATVTEREFQKLRAGKRRAKIRNRWVEVAQERILSTPEQCHRWIGAHRDDKGHAEKLDQFHIGVSSKSIMRQVVRERRERAGIAKGGWLGAGMMIAKRQSGTERITIGKNFLGYAQKHSKRGSAKPGGDGFKPFATLSNRARHTGSSYVLSQSERRKAIAFGARKTISWYRRAAKKALEK